MESGCFAGPQGQSGKKGAERATGGGFEPGRNFHEQVQGACGVVAQGFDDGGRFAVIAEVSGDDWFGAVAEGGGALRGPLGLPTHGDNDAQQDKAEDGQNDGRVEGQTQNFGA